MKKQNIRVSRKKRVRGGGKEEDLLRLIGANNPHVNNNKLVVYNEDKPFVVETPENASFFHNIFHDPSSPKPRTIDIAQKTRVINALKQNAMHWKNPNPFFGEFENFRKRVFITTHGMVGYDLRKLSDDWAIIIHNDGYRLPNAYLLRSFESTFVWSMCARNKAYNNGSFPVEYMTENIIRHSNICRVFGTLFTRFKIIEEKKDDRRFNLEIKELDEIEAILYLFINLIIAYTDDKIREWLQHEDLIVIKDIARFSPTQFNLMFSHTLYENKMTSKDIIPIDETVINCLASIREHGYVYIQNLFDRVITKLYMFDESLLAANEKNYNAGEFSRFFNSYSTPSDNNKLELTLPRVPPLMNTPPLRFENMKAENYGIELLKRTFPTDSNVPVYTENMNELVKKMEESHSKKWNEYLEHSKRENSTRKKGGGRHTRRTRRSRV
jgi:hypothetical protein